MSNFQSVVEYQIKDLFHQAMHVLVTRATRFTAGLCHYVYDVQTSGGNFVLRVARPENIPFMEGALYWDKVLRPMGVPLPKIYAEDIYAKEHPFSFYIMERLDGVDLGDIYADLTTTEKQKIAEKINEIQEKVSTLPKGDGFGWTTLPNNTKSLVNNWIDYVGDIEKKRAQIQKIGIFSNVYADKLSFYFDQIKNEMAAIPPTPFLDDLQTKNVLIDQSHKLVGIVDVDGMTYGDRLFHIALVNMALLCTEQSADYVDMLMHFAGFGKEKRVILNTYTLSFCVEFMAETGQAFNRSQVQVDLLRVERLKRVFDEISARLES